MLRPRHPCHRDAAPMEKALYQSTFEGTNWIQGRCGALLRGAQVSRLILLRPGEGLDSPALHLSILDPF